MITVQDIQKETIENLLEKYPFLPGFFEENTLEIDGQINKNLDDFLNILDEDEEKENRAMDKTQVMEAMATYITQMLSFLGEDVDGNDEVHNIIILPGTNKSGQKEQFDKLTINKSEIVCIVGPTGSGKSRLLADIEWVAENDTPTSRSILVNGEKGDKKWRVTSGPVSYTHLTLPTILRV